MCVCVYIYIYIYIYIHTYIHHFFFIHSSVDGHLGCFHVLATINCTAMNIGVQLSFQITVFVFFRYISRNEIAGSYGSSIFSVLRNFYNVFHSGCINLHSHQQCQRVSFSPHPHQHLLSVFFLMVAILASVGWYVIVFWIAFLWWLAMLSIFSCAYWPSAFRLWKHIYSGLLPIFQSGCLFFWCWVVWAVYISWILTPYRSYHLQIASPIQ